MVKMVGRFSLFRLYLTQILAVVLLEIPTRDKGSMCKLFIEYWSLSWHYFGLNECRGCTSIYFKEPFVPIKLNAVAITQIRSWLDEFCPGRIVSSGCKIEIVLAPFTRPLLRSIAFSLSCGAFLFQHIFQY